MERNINYILHSEGEVVGWVDLPHGYMDFKGPSKAVVTIGQVNDWAAYIDSGEKSLKQIAEKGIKLFKNEAVELFPTFNPAMYRH